MFDNLNVVQPINQETGKKKHKNKQKSKSYSSASSRSSHVAARFLDLNLTNGLLQTIRGCSLGTLTLLALFFTQKPPIGFKTASVPPAQIT